MENEKKGRLLDLGFFLKKIVEKETQGRKG
jgi:hypothetical protein